jgi:hypothetical protein
VNELKKLQQQRVKNILVDSENEVLDDKINKLMKYLSQVK